MRMSEQTDLHVQQEQQNIYNHNTKKITMTQTIRITVYVKTVKGENFRSFRSIARESFHVENFTRLGIHYYKKLLP